MGLITDILDVLDKGGKVGKSVHRWLQNRADDPLHGDASTGMGVANRIIALFSAHGVKQTQIYRLIGESHSQVTPDLSAKKLQRILNGQLITDISILFGVRREWLEGDSGRIYDPLIHYKNLSGFINFALELKSRPSDCFCMLEVFKPFRTSFDPYKDSPDIALVFSIPIAEINHRFIYKYCPIYGPFPWDHAPARFHLFAFFNFAYATQSIFLKGYEVNSSAIAKISDGSAIPHHKIKMRGIWHPEDYAYPQGQYNGKVKVADWERFLDYFDDPELRKYLRINFPER